MGRNEAGNIGGNIVEFRPDQENYVARALPRVYWPCQPLKFNFIFNNDSPNKAHLFKNVRLQNVTGRTVSLFQSD